MKKILLVTRPITPPWDEASKNFAYYLAKTLKSFDFYLLTKGILPDFPNHIHQVPIYSSGKMQMSFFQKAKLLKLIGMRKNFDIIHFMLTPNKLNAFGFKTFIKNDEVKTIQTIATLREDLYSDEDFQKIIFADLVITYSDHAKNKLLSLGFPNVVRIYPGIDLQKFSYAPKHIATLAMFDIKNSDFVITYPGEYVRLGATDMIIDSLPEIFEKIPNAKFVFACRIKNNQDARKKDDVVAKLTEMKIIDRVVFTDTFSDMPKIYNFSDVVVFPVQDMHGKFDVPLAVIEAMACEKPIIISNLPILREFTSEENCVIIQSENQSQFVEKLIELSKDPETRTILGKNARKFAEESFDIDSIDEQYKTVYEKL